MAFIPALCAFARRRPADGAGPPTKMATRTAAQMEDCAVFPRIREITDAFGARLQISVEAHPTGALVVFDRPDRTSYPSAVLDGYGVEVLCGYIMAARLALPYDLPDEIVDGPFAVSFALVRTDQVSLTMQQKGARPAFEIPAPFWDRLYAELCVVIAHAREIGRRSARRLQ